MHLGDVGERVSGPLINHLAGTRINLTELQDQILSEQATSQTDAIVVKQKGIGFQECSSSFTSVSRQSGAGQATALAS